jgi:hypothetical protein
MNWFAMHRWKAGAKRRSKHRKNVPAYHDELERSLARIVEKPRRKKKKKGTK